MASTARLDELKKKFDENPRRYFAPLANEHRKSGDLDQAIALCRTHLPQQPAHISGHIVLAQALYEAGGLDESREIFHTALGLDPENLIALRYLGDIARDSADIDTARSWYQRVLEVDPRNDEIVQLVRDLDAPRHAEPQQAAEAPAQAAEPPAVAAVAPASAAEPAKAPENDERFAPLSLDQLDIDGTSAEPTAHASIDVPSAAVSEASLDVGAEWGTDSASTEHAMLDTPGIDPFEMPADASAASLFDPSAQEPTDYFLDAFAPPSATNEAANEPELIESAEWTSSPEPAPEASAPEAPTPAPAAELDVSAFEEGSFYLEPAPAAPVDETPAQTEASTGWSLASETPDAPRPVAEPSQSTPTPEVVAEAPHEIDIAAIAEAPTAEWSAPEAQAAQAPVEPPAESGMELGLETMEFVPPSRPTPASVSAVSSPNADPVLGRSSELAAEQSSTPAAFVTETMAELYLQQGFRNEALAVYRELLARNPSDASLRERIEKIESGSMSSIGMAMVSENVVESALRRQSAKPQRSVRSFFAALASRRAPAPREIPVSELAPDAVNEPEMLEAAAPSEAPESSPMTSMMSAAETLASYDPFAEEAVPETEIDIPAPELLPNEPQPVAEAPMFPVAAPPVSPAFVEPSAPAVSEPPAPPIASQSEAPARKTLEDLFPDTSVAPRTEAAAHTLATAFGRQEPQGRPTRAASSELSLDKVFRGSSEGAPPADGGFSFDQFFSDSRSGGDVAAAPTVSPAEAGRSGGGTGDAHDIEQFTAWLEGLKKK